MKRRVCMIAWLTLHAAALEFDLIAIPGLEVGPVNTLTGQPSTNYRHADLNNDGRLDLILPDAVYMAADGGFNLDAPMPPPVPGRAAADVWKDRVYVLGAERWQVLRCHEGAWVEEYSHARIASDKGSLTPLAPEAGIRWTRFLYDFNVDGQPEVVLVREDGVHLLRVERDGVSELAVLNVLPAMELARVPDQALWPASSRRLAYPSQQLDCRLIIDTASIVVITREHAANARVRYRAVPYRVDTSTWTAFAEERNVLRTPPMPAFMQPCRLNVDTTLDFAGGDWEFSSTRILPVPIHVTAASTNGGEDIQMMRTQSYSPQTMFVDFDGDDRMDMVTNTTGLFRGGLRESLNRITSNRSVEHQIRVYPQTAAGDFSETPSITASFRVELDRTPFEHGEMFRLYQASQLFDVTGDFDDDGRKDFAARLRRDRLDVFLSGKEGIKKNPDVSITVDEPSWRYAVADVNSDGVSDVIVFSGGDEAARVYLTRRAAP